MSMEIETTRALIVVPSASRTLAPIEAPARAPRGHGALTVSRDPDTVYLRGTVLPNACLDNDPVPTKGVYIDIYV